MVNEVYLPKRDRIIVGFLWRHHVMKWYCNENMGILIITNFIKSYCHFLLYLFYLNWQLFKTKKIFPVMSMCSYHGWLGQHGQCYNTNMQTELLIFSYDFKCLVKRLKDPATCFKTKTWPGFSSIRLLEI